MAANLRLKLRFSDPTAMQAALARRGDLPGTVEVANRKRSYVAVSTEAGQAAMARFATGYGAATVPDVRYDLEAATGDSPTDVATALAQIRARLGLEGTGGTARGAGATVAVVDTGVDPSTAGIDTDRRSGGFAPGGQDPWEDYDDRGHGSLSARIACGTDGIAPGAAVVSCRTHFYDSELAAAYDYLVDEVQPRLPTPLIVTNSFGRLSGRPPEPDPHSDFVPALTEALGAGVLVVFSAGNYHLIAGGTPESCSPTSIWLYKCLADVITVGASTLDGTMQDFSSRGPGQLAGQPGAGAKPDLCAPVPDPAWGTSAASPQAAGVSALVAGARPAMGAAEIRGALLGAARDLGLARDCQGAGQLDAAATVPLR